MTEGGDSFARLLLLKGHAHVIQAHVARHSLLEDFFQSRRRLVRAVARGGAAIDLRRRVFVVVHDEFGARTWLEFGQVR